MTWRRPLTGHELDQLREMVEEADTAEGARDAVIRRIYDFALRDEGLSFDEVDEITPWHFELPKRQVLEILNWLMRRAADEDGLSPLLTWMNIGPSSYEDSETGVTP